MHLPVMEDMLYRRYSKETRALPLGMAVSGAKT